MQSAFYSHLKQQTAELVKQGLFKKEHLITSPQKAEITSDSKKVLNFCANNYLGLANDPAIIQAAKDSYKDYGFGLASVRFICGTQSVHKTLEQRLSAFLKTEDTILYSSCFDANAGLFETVLEEEDAIISDALNHASIIDGIRLCKAKRFRYQNNDMKDLELKLQETQSARFRLIATDGVFSMDGTVANLSKICDLADQYQALVMVDDCHAVGFMGKEGRGTPEFCNVLGRIDMLTGTLGKALGGASGGYTSGKKELIDWLRQRSRPYLFSNTLAPAIAAASLKVLDILESDHELKERLHSNASYFRKKMTALGFNLVPGFHPIIPIMLGEAKLAQEFAAKMLENGIYVVAFSYPVVPMKKARIRTQISAIHTLSEINLAVNVFQKVGKEMGVISYS